MSCRRARTRRLPRDWRERAFRRRARPPRRRGHRSASLLFAHYLVYVQDDVVHAWCEWCLARDAVLRRARRPHCRPRDTLTSEPALGGRRRGERVVCLTAPVPETCPKAHELLLSRQHGQRIHLVKRFRRDRTPERDGGPPYQGGAPSYRKSCGFAAILRQARRIENGPPVTRRCSVVLPQTTKSAICGDFLAAKALWRTRTVDPLLTMERLRQVATDGSGFRLSEPFSAPSHLPPVATSCDRWAP